MIVHTRNGKVINTDNVGVIYITVCCTIYGTEAYLHFVCGGNDITERYAGEPGWRQAQADCETIWEWIAQKMAIGDLRQVDKVF